MGHLSASPPLTVGAIPVTKTVAINTVLGAGTYDLLTASGGDVVVTLAVVSCGATAVTGLVSVSVQTNDAPVWTIMSAAEGAVANLGANTVDKTNTISTTLHSGKKIQYTTVGIGLAGSLVLTVTYLPLALGAVLS